jgi:hypothetical protein
MAKSSKRSKRSKSAKSTKSTKSAKRKAAKKTAPRKTTRRKSVARRRIATDRCGPLRQQVDRILTEINDLQIDLGDFDIPPDLRERLKQLLRQRQALLANVQRALAECEALPDHRITRA